MALPYLEINPDKVQQNAEIITGAARAAGISVAGVTKVTCAQPEVGRVLLDGGCSYLADSRLENLARLRGAGLPRPYLLLRLPSPSRAAETVELADCSLVSETSTVRCLGEAARAAGKTHRVILMVDLGDLREGVWPDRTLETARAMAEIPGIELHGLGTNLTCYGGVCPTPENLGRLAALAAELRQSLGLELPVVSGGNSSSLDMLFAGQLPARINHLRIGEGILLGRETVARQPVPGAHLDAFRLVAEVVEVGFKPSVPIGRIGQDAFGNTPVFEDRGIHRRAILAIGRQDVSPDALTPVEDVDILGASSDHLLVDVTRLSEVAVGDTLSFIPDYGGVLALSTSPYVEKRIV
ncbi:MAG: alanine/ornithine racemase family PLP-dependent enzyme [Bacillota bacterium]